MRPRVTIHNAARKHYESRRGRRGAPLPEPVLVTPTRYYTTADLADELDRHGDRLRELIYVARVKPLGAINGTDIYVADDLGRLREALREMRSVT